jgi:hypothetical protein
MVPGSMLFVSMDKLKRSCPSMFSRFFSILEDDFHSHSRLPLNESTPMSFEKPCFAPEKSGTHWMDNIFEKGFI